MFKHLIVVSIPGTSCVILSFRTPILHFVGVPLILSSSAVGVPALDAAVAEVFFDEPKNDRHLGKGFSSCTSSADVDILGLQVLPNPEGQCKKRPRFVRKELRILVLQCSER
jgi:hypothetical protein